jgi:PHD/YefM family antitoxin component YafN of YafNO toxin-antitoxin module
MILVEHNKADDSFLMHSKNGETVTLTNAEATAIFYAAEDFFRKEDLYLYLENAREPDGRYQLGSVGDPVALTDKDIESLVAITLPEYKRSLDNSDEWSDIAGAALAREYPKLRPNKSRKKTKPKRKKCA